MPTFYLKRTFRLKEPSGSQKKKQKTKQNKKNFNEDNNNNKKFQKSHPCVMFKQNIQTFRSLKFIGSNIGRVAFLPRPVKSKKRNVTRAVTLPR